jgi:threonine/homoserine efflux transporter RhtA
VAGLAFGILFIGLAQAGRNAGLLAIAAVLVSLYPGVTVLLGRALLHERLTPAQRAGLGLCALAVAAIAL